MMNEDKVYVINECCELINNIRNYKLIVEKLLKNDMVMIGWTDGVGTHQDIAFKLNSNNIGYIQRGLKPYDLYVGIVPNKFYGFDPKNKKHNSYIKEKLQLGNSLTDDLICDLVNGVIEELNKKVNYDKRS